MKEAKLFKNGRSQAVRLPKEYRFSGRSVYIRNLGEAVVLFPKKHSWDLLARACEQFTDDFMNDREQGAQDRDDFFS